MLDNDFSLLGCYIEIDWERIRSINPKERSDIKEYILTLVTIGYDVRCTGIDGLRKALLETTDSFMEIGYRLIMSGRSPTAIISVLGNLLSASKLGNDNYTKYIIFIQFLLLIQRGSTKVDLEAILMSFQGMSYADHIARLAF